MATQSDVGGHVPSAAGSPLPIDPAPFGANAMRLSLPQFGIAATIVCALLFAIPRLWDMREPVDTRGEDRMPYAMSEDYWLYGRRAARAVEDARIVILGDSVVWGEYVTSRETISQYLSELAVDRRFANGGLNGAHPLALSGLVRYHASALARQHIVLHCNLLWMSSPERDLRSEKELAFNHPQLVPQFSPAIPCYKASLADRMGITIDRGLLFRNWVRHMRIAYLDGQDLHSWSLEHPYEIPLAHVLGPRRADEETPRHQAVAWQEQGIEPQDFPWIELATSLQWQAFRETIMCLRSRQNEVLVVIGPLNEHMLTLDSRQRFEQLSREVRAWLESELVPHFAPAVLPSDEFADASHPLSAGYRRLAGEIYASEVFREWLGK